MGRPRIQLLRDVGLLFGLRVGDGGRELRQPSVLRRRREAAGGLVHQQVRRYLRLRPQEDPQVRLPLKIMPSVLMKAVVVVQKVNLGSGDLSSCPAGFFVRKWITLKGLFIKKKVSDMTDKFSKI